MKVYLVIRHQTNCEYDKCVVDVFDAKENAIEQCREYNKDYAENVGVNSHYDFTGQILGDYYHYYDWAEYEVK